MFTTGTIVTGSTFLDRKKHIPILKAYLDNKQSVMLKASRRFGKSSLVLHTLEHYGPYNYIYLDLQFFKDLEQAANKIINEAYQKAGVEGHLTIAAKSGGAAILNIFKSLKKIKIDGIGELTLEQLGKQKDHVELFLHALETAEKIAEKKGFHIYIVLDEFQEILNLSDKSLLSKFRSVAQHHKHVTYIFLGSIESIMNKVFADKKSPFFKFSQMMDLPPLDTGEIFEYADKVFKDLGVIDTNEIEKLIDFLGGHPDYTMSCLQMLYYTCQGEKKSKISHDLVMGVLSDVFKSNLPYVAMLLSSASKNKNAKEVLYCMSNNLQINLPSQTTYYTRTALEEVGLIRHLGKGQYEIADIFLRLALLDSESTSLTNDERIFLAHRPHE